MLQLGIIQENNVLYFVIGKRFHHETPFLSLDRERVKSAVETYQRVVGRKQQCSINQPGEFVKAVFNHFVERSPFKEYVLQSVAPRDLNPLFTQFTREACAILQFK